MRCPSVISVVLKVLLSYSSIVTLDITHGNGLKLLARMLLHMRRIANSSPADSLCLGEVDVIHLQLLLLWNQL